MHGLKARAHAKKPRAEMLRVLVEVERSINTAAEKAVRPEVDKDRHTFSIMLYLSGLPAR
jgi:hypothetical protein